MKKFWNWVLEVVPIIVGLFWTTIITLGSVAVLIVVVKWLMNLMGVM